MLNKYSTDSRGPYIVHMNYLMESHGQNDERKNVILVWERD